MPCKTRISWPFSGLFSFFQVILTSEGYLLKITLKDVQTLVPGQRGRKSNLQAHPLQNPPPHPIAKLTAPSTWLSLLLKAIPKHLLVRTRSTTTRDRNLQFRGAGSTGGSPLDFLLFLPSMYVQFSKTSPLKSGESSEKSNGENRVKSCHVCGCHVFFGPDWGFDFLELTRRCFYMFCQP